MGKIIDFLIGVKVELARVVWPTPKTTLRLTVIVILVTIVVGFFVGAIDYILTELLARLLQT
ncbi:MAG: preprotein translocase subunit SecE [Candidatus Daviesbacteria bacterium]|nr:preprotein translocase subunit SecE [Candidatus Daviesbacteria bacterium]